MIRRALKNYVALNSRENIPLWLGYRGMQTSRLLYILGWSGKPCDQVRRGLRYWWKHIGPAHWDIRLGIHRKPSHGMHYTPQIDRNIGLDGTLCLHSRHAIVSRTSGIDDRSNLWAEPRPGRSAQDAATVKVSVGDVPSWLPFHGQSTTDFLDSLCLILIFHPLWRLSFTLLTSLSGYQTFWFLAVEVYDRRVLGLVGNLITLHPTKF